MRSDDVDKLILEILDRILEEEAKVVHKSNIKVKAPGEKINILSEDEIWDLI